MSELNFDWVKENFEGKTLVFFDIGCADLGDSRHIKNIMPQAEVYSFECSQHWLENNLESSVQNGIHYFHVAVSDVDGKLNIFPSLSQRGEYHPWSSSMFALREISSGKIYGEPYSVNSVRLETFCNKFGVTPDFIHIDVEGAEFKVFQNIGRHKPKFVWAEVGAFHHYDTGVSFEEFDSLMQSLNYSCIYKTGADALYVLSGYNHTPYRPKP